MSDILRKLETHEIERLRDVYSRHQDNLPQVYSFTKTALKWIASHPEYITIFGVGDNWEEDGSFIALLTFSCYDLYLHSLDTSGRTIYRGLTETKQIKWDDHPVLFYAMHENFVKIVLEAMKTINVPVIGCDRTNLWQIMREDALKLSDNFENEEFYMDSVQPEDAEVINEVWPPRYEGSLEYLKTFIRMNGGIGMYEKSSGKLVAWILHNIIGQLGVLQTRDGYFQRGFAAAVTKKLSRKIAQNGDHPIGTVHHGNVASEKLFTKLGFHKRYSCIYISVDKTANPAMRSTMRD